MKISIKQSKYVEIETDDIEFPLYGKHDVGPDGYTVHMYTKTIREGGRFRIYSITHKEHPRVSFDLESDLVLRLSGDTPDEVLCRGWYASSREEFEAVAAKAREYLDAMLVEPRRDNDLTRGP